MKKFVFLIASLFALVPALALANSHSMSRYNSSYSSQNQTAATCKQIGHQSNYRVQNMTPSYYTQWARAYYCHHRLGKYGSKVMQLMAKRHYFNTMNYKHTSFCNCNQAYQNQIYYRNQNTNNTPSISATSTVGDLNANTNTAPVTASITIADFNFNPATLTINQGTTVTWTNNGPSPHTVTSDNDVFSSGILNVGEQFQYTFNTPGTYNYHCSTHPVMTGTIVVN